MKHQFSPFKTTLKRLFEQHFWNDKYSLSEIKDKIEALALTHDIHTKIYTDRYVENKYRPESKDYETTLTIEFVVITKSEGETD